MVKKPRLLPLVNSNCDSNFGFTEHGPVILIIPADSVVGKNRNKSPNSFTIPPRVFVKLTGVLACFKT